MYAYFTFTALAPTIITHPTDTYAAAPFSGVFTCSAKGCGKLNVIWHRQNNSLSEKVHSTLVRSPNQVTNTLIIPNVTNEDIGNYYCVAWAKVTATRSKVANLFLAGKVLVTIYFVTVCRYNIII